MRFSIAVPGTFHAFDVANALYKNGKLEKIYSYSDFLRILKWKKDTPFSKIFFFKWPPIKRGKMTRKNGAIKFASLIKKDDSDIIIGFPGISKVIFENNPHKIKILDIDHFNWDKEIVNLLKNEKYKFFNKKPINPSEIIMQKNELENEYNKRGIKFNIDKNIFFNEPIECELSDIVMVPVSYVKNTLIKAGYPKEKILVNPYGYDEKVFYPASNKKFKKTVLHGGTISIRKGWYYLKEILKAFDGSDIKFFIAGGIEDSLKDEVEKFFKNTKQNIRYLGSLNQKKLAYYMRHSNLFIFPSVLEGFGMTVLQAMASGTVVITTKATCGIDLIKNKENGYVFNKEDISTWIATIQDIIYDEEKLKNMGNKSFKVAKTITWDNYANNIINFLEKNNCIKKL